MSQDTIQQPTAVDEKSNPDMVSVMVGIWSGNALIAGIGSVVISGSHPDEPLLTAAVSTLLYVAGWVALWKAYKVGDFQPAERVSSVIRE